MKYLVTGGTGFLGKYIVSYLQRSGNKVYILTRNPERTNEIIADFENGILDLKTNQIFFSENDQLIVIHAAGKAHFVPKSDAERRSFFHVNVDGTRLLLEKLETLPELPKSFIFVSSVSVYGKEAGIDIKEDEPLLANDAYGKSKIEAEKIVLEWGKKNNVTVGVVRLPLVAGQNPQGNLKAMINGIKSGRYFRIGSGIAHKSMVWAADVASALPVIAEKGGVYNLTDGCHPTFAELEDRITQTLQLNPVKKMPLFLASLAGIAGSMAEFVFRKKMPINRIMVSKITKPLTFSDQKAREAFGWHPSKVLDHIDEILL